MLAVSILIHKSPSYKESRASLLPPPARHRSLLTGIQSRPVLQHFLCVASGHWSSTKCSRGQVTGPASKQKANANPSHSYLFDPTPEALEPQNYPCLTDRLSARASLPGSAGAVS